MNDKTALSARSVRSAESAIVRTLIFVIQLYRHMVSPLRLPTCRFTPTCSQYAVDALAEFGLVLPPEVEVRVEDSNQKCRFMVLPVRPAGTENWTEEQLAEIVTRDCMIGVALPRPDRKADDVRPVHKAARPVQSEHH